ncbi:MAG: SMP-30/gluconolactonase/LRE family protein [Planctomycetes bacterium]|nr:SMP-30/gluconolactonase/LRE family protein [Planctomycetota bacterium]
MKAQPSVDLLIDAKAQLGEGPSWSVSRQALWWVDIFAHEIHLTDVATRRDQSWKLPGRIGAVVERRSGGVAVAWQHGFAGFDPASGVFERWCDPEAHLPGNRFNDGKVDSAGRFWAGTAVEVENGPKGALYRFDSGRRATAMVGGVGCSNGLAWSADDRTFYYIDTMASCIVAYAFDAERGELGERRVVAETPFSEHGYCDGMTIDVEGMLWVAHWGLGQVSRWDPKSGKRIGVIRIPAANTTSCCFGGAKLDELYVTTAAHGLDEQQRLAQPHAGGVFVVRPGVAGLPTTPFAG